MKDSMREVAVASLGLDKSSNTPVVILREKDGEGVLPIWIGPGEASAIAMKLAGIDFSRPLTHDLMTTVLKGLGGELVRVMVTKVVDNTYYASLIIERDGEMISVDARPSDSIALALRADADIYADRDLLELKAVEVDESDLEAGEAPENFLDQEAPAGGGSGTGTETAEESGQDLKDYLEGLNPEDFGRFSP